MSNVANEQVNSGTTIRYCRPSISGAPVSGSAIVECCHILDAASGDVAYEVEDEDTGEMLMLHHGDIVKVLARDEFSSGPTEIDFRVSQRVVSTMAVAGVSLRDLAARTGLDPERLADLLDLRTTWPVAWVMEIARALDLELAELVDIGLTGDADADAAHAVKCASCGVLVAWSPYPVSASLFCRAHADSGTDQKVRPTFTHDELANFMDQGRA
ncbi:hypothetical protein NOVA_03945 [Nocardia nova]|uniref:hypothetical protein n=1 Tax=Nocardia nova TaxID=37330 RepID=UPI001C473C09|nr:hypothetical protein [Nocardia nova]MBV7701913.1 hypothetical protein [Nocardia nova]